MSTLRTNNLQTVDSSFTVAVNEIASVANSVKVVSTASELRLISNPNVKGAFITSYGQGYYYDQSDTTSVDDGVLVIVSTSGMRWKIGVGAHISVKLFGAKGDGVTDDSQAIVKAHSTGKTIYYPSGTYVCSQQVVITGPFGIKGEGINKTVIKFTGVTQGFKVTQQDSSQGIQVSGLSLQTTTTSTSTVALLIDGTPQVGVTSDGAGHFIIGDRTSVRCYVEELDCRGTTDLAGWGVNLQFKSIMNFAVDKFSFRGSIPLTVGNLQGIGLLINGDGVPVDFSVNRVWGYYTLYGILMPDYIEGGHIRNYELVAVVFGIIGRYTPGISVLAESACGCLAMYLDDGHLNVLQAGIIFNNTNQTHIENQNIYLQPRATDSKAFAIQLQNGNQNDISSVFIGGDQAQNTKTDNYGIALLGVGLSTISNVKAQSVEAVVSMFGSSGNNIEGVSSNGCKHIVSADGVSTNNYMNGRWSNQTTNIKFNVDSTKNLVQMEEYSVVVTQNVPSASTYQFSVPLPVGLYSEAPKAAVLSLNAGLEYIKCIYLRSSSTANSASFLIAPASPATTFTAQQMEFSVSTKGI